MADSDAEALALLGPLQDGPLTGRELGQIQGRTSIAEENLAQTAQNPEGYRYAVDCTWTDAPASVLAPLLHEMWGELDTVHRRTAGLAAHGAGVYLGDTDFTRRNDRFLSEEAYRRLAEIRAGRDPADRFAPYLTSDPGRLNVHG